MFTVFYTMYFIFSLFTARMKVLFGFLQCLKFNRYASKYCPYKRSANHSCLQNRGPLKVLNETELILNDQQVTQTHLESIQYHSERLESPYSTNKEWQSTFLQAWYSEAALVVRSRYNFDGTPCIHGNLPVFVITTFGQLKSGLRTGV